MTPLTPPTRISYLFFHAALEAAGAEVRHGVDATCLHVLEPPLDAAGRFDRVVFNFPHTGGKNKIKQNRSLVQRFLKGTDQLLKSGGQVHIALGRGQGGTPADQPPRLWVDHWQVRAPLCA